MSWEVEFCSNRATEEEVANHLVLCDARFVPPLSSRVEIKEYAHKIWTKAMRFEAWAEGALIGLVAVYCDKRQRLAYITNVSVSVKPPGARIASVLLQKGIEYLNEAGFGRVELEVDRDNHRAIDLYSRHGFIAKESSGRALIMGRDL